METITVNAGRLRLLLAEIESVAVKLDPNCPFDCPAKSDECGWGCSYHLEAWLTEWAEAQPAALEEVKSDVTTYDDRWPGDDLEANVRGTAYELHLDPLAQDAARVAAEAGEVQL